MRLKDHIAFDFLTKGDIATAIVNQACPEEVELLKHVDLSRYTVMGENNKYKQAELKYNWIWNLAAPPLATPAIPHKAYYLTESICEKVDLIKVNKGPNGYDWTIFKDIPEGKSTFIFRNDSVLRFHVIGQLISFLHVKGRKKPTMAIIWVDRVTNEKHEAFENELKTSMDELKLYKLLTFFYFAENSEVIVNPGKKHGTKKQPDSLYNETNYDVVIINNNWNVTSIRAEGFDVSGHFRLQACGPGLKERRLIFIKPFKKDGYVRKATNQIQK